MRIVFKQPGIRNLKGGALLLLALFLAWSLSRLPIQQAWKAILALHPLQVLALALLNLGILLLFNSRWWLILRALDYRPRFFSLLGYRLAGFGISYVTPGAQFGGEPLQVYLLQSRQGIPASTAITAVVLDKFFEVLSNFTFLAIGIAVMLFAGAQVHTPLPWVLPLTAGVLGLPLAHLLALRSGRWPLARLAEKLAAGRLSGILFHRSWVRRALEGIAASEAQMGGLWRAKPAALAWLLLLSALIWGAMICEYWITLRFLGLEPGPLETIRSLTAARLAFLAPVPAGLGALEASQVLALQALGYAPALGLSISLIIRARDLAFAGLGLWFSAAYARSHKAHQPASNRVPGPPALAENPMIE